MIAAILIASDGSPGAYAAECYATQLAAKLSAPLQCLTVIEDRLLLSLRAEGLDMDTGATTPPETIEAFQKARAEAICRRAAELARQAGVEFSAEIARGNADERIASLGQQTADLLVLGREGEHAEAHSMLPGSTLEGVVRLARRPVLSVPPGAELSGPVLLAFDDSPGARIAAHLALELARRIGESLHIFVDSKDKGRAAARFAQAHRLLGETSVPLHEESATVGRPDVKLVEMSHAARYSAIVMGAYGRSRKTEFFLGSNAASTLRSAPAAVLLAR
ncbi:MAG: universal stress protein [Deltaproteobacteria bacterium]|nr:universal stress protein [Deltaproteobacteria bacterium]